MGGSSNGRTTDSDSVYLGSNPSPPAIQYNGPPRAGRSGFRDRMRTLGVRQTIAIQKTADQQRGERFWVAAGRSRVWGSPRRGGHFLIGSAANGPAVAGMVTGGGYEGGAIMRRVGSRG